MPSFTLPRLLLAGVAAHAAMTYFPKAKRPGFIKSNLVTGIVAGAGALLALDRFMPAPVAATPVNGLGNMFNRPWEGQQAFAGGRNKISAQDARQALGYRVPSRTPAPAPVRRRYSLR